MRQLKITQQITNRETASLDKYLTEIGREELITAEQEVELARKIKQMEDTMYEHAKNLEFEDAARLRDELAELKQQAFLN